jgi:hypothetical protein
MRVTLIATGFREDVQRKREAEDKRRLSLGLRPETSRPSAAERAPAPSLQMVAPPAAPPTVAEMRRERESREPAPSLKPSSFDEIFGGGALSDEPAPRASAPAPAAPVADEKPRAGASLKDTLLAMMNESDSPRAKAPEAARPATNGGAVKAAPAMTAEPSHPSVRPANKPAVAAPVAAIPASPRGGARILPNEDVLPAIPALDEPPAETRDSKGSNGYDTPAFMRRRNLFE